MSFLCSRGNTLTRVQSGTGVTYNPSIIVDITYQCIAPNLTIGQRLPPQIIARAADGDPVELQDLIEVDFRHKVLILAGDSSCVAQRSILNDLVDHLDSPKGFVKRFTPKGLGFNDVFDIISIAKTDKFAVNYNDIPERLRSHWSK